jgi:hypothetical protein
MPAPQIVPTAEGKFAAAIGFEAVGTYDTYEDAMFALEFVLCRKDAGQQVRNNGATQVSSSLREEDRKHWQRVQRQQFLIDLLAANIIDEDQAERARAIA